MALGNQQQNFVTQNLVLYEVTRFLLLLPVSVVLPENCVKLQGVCVFVKRIWSQGSATKEKGLGEWGEFTSGQRFL